MSCHPFQIDEVSHSIVEELVALSPRSAVSLALCCSSLTDVSLSVLWEQQKKLSTLVKVLPPDAWAYEETESPTGQLTLLRNISPEERENLRKYASWMRELEFLEDEDEISKDVFDLLLRYPHSQPLCPRLLKLSWMADSIFGGDFVHFLSPQLQEVYLASSPQTTFSFPHTISALPISSLKTLRLSLLGGGAVKDAIFSLFGASPVSLTVLEVSHMDQLWDSTWCRVLLPFSRLRILETDQFPPTMLSQNFPVFFPNLRQARFRGPAASRWIYFLSDNSGRTIPSDRGTRSRLVAPLLTLLSCSYDGQLDGTFASCFLVFRHLSSLLLASGCNGRGCAFRLTDEDTSRLATHLPGLRRLSLGFVCPHNTCTTTVNSLLVLSTHCKGLHDLQFHFNTRNLARDMKESFNNPLRRISSPPSRCPLVALDVWLAPLTAEALGGETFPTLAGFVDIFPNLQRIRFGSHGRSRVQSCGWQQLDAQISSFQEMRESLPVVFAPRPIRSSAPRNGQPRN